MVRQAHHERADCAPSRSVAVVTGASTGIGRATAKRLATEGYSVVLTARRGDLLEDVADEIRSDGGEALVVAGDIADAEVSVKVIRRAAIWGRLDVLVANAGMGYTGPFELMTDEEMQLLVNVNVLGVMRTVRECLPEMKKAGGGKIVIIGSVLSRIASPGTAVYGATKHAVAGFADSLRYEVRRHGIRIITVLPGYTATDFFDCMIRRGERSVDVIKKFWFFHTPDDVAAVIARRIKHPKAEIVVGVVNTAIVFLGTRFPSLYSKLLITADSLAGRFGGTPSLEEPAPDHSVRKQTAVSS